MLCQGSKTSIGGEMVSSGILHPGYLLGMMHYQDLSSPFFQSIALFLGSERVDCLYWQLKKIGSVKSYQHHIKSLGVYVSAVLSPWHNCLSILPGFREGGFGYILEDFGAFLYTQTCLCMIRSTRCLRYFEK